MSKYTTGEIAGLCGVSVRTVQYYDTRAILIPSELSEGGRRLYSEDDLKRLRIICFLREAGVSINRISQLFEESHPEKVIFLLLAQQEKEIRAEIEEGKKKLELVEDIHRELKTIDVFSVESIGDIAHVMKQKNKLAKMRLRLILGGIPLAILQWTSVILWIVKGNWYLFAAWVFLSIPWSIIASAYYFRNTAYICPECHEIFRPKFKESFFAYHTPKMRRLTCPKCGHKGLCIETFAERRDLTHG